MKLNETKSHSQKAGVMKGEFDSRNIVITYVLK